MCIRDSNKLAGNAVNLIRERGASVFDASVPKRVGMQKVIGHAFPSNLNGYELSLIHIFPESRLGNPSNRRNSTAEKRNRVADPWKRARS